MSNVVRPGLRVERATIREVTYTLDSTGAARGRTSRTSLVLELVASIPVDGTTVRVVGRGEAAPLPGMSIETLDEARAALEAFAAKLPFDIGCTDDTVTRSPSARFAIETALLDVLAQHEAISIGDEARAWVVDDPEAAKRAIESGAACLKIKVGPGDDRDRIRAIAAAAPGVPLRLDANRSWPRAAVIDRLTALARIGLPIEFVEEPCDNAIKLLAQPSLAQPSLAPVLPLQIALDESLAGLSAAELEGALASPSLGALILKPTLLGGFAACLALAERARAAGVRVIVTHTLEGPIGFAACCELARMIGGGPHGLAPYLASERADHACAVTPTLETVDLNRPTAVPTHASPSPNAAPVAEMPSGRGVGDVHAALTATPTLETVAAIRAAFDARRPLVLLHHALSEGELDRRRALVEHADLGDAAFVLFTSGSTGDARGVVLSRAAVEAAAMASAAHLGWRADDRWLVALSTAHAGGLAAVMRCHLAGKPIELLEGEWDRARAAGLLERCTLASLVPTQLASLLDDPAWRPPARLRAVLLGGAAASPALLARAAERRVPFLCTYGMTETFGQIATAHAAGDPDAPLTPLPGVEIEAGTRVAPARIAVRGGMLATRYLDGMSIAPRFETSDVGFVEDGAVYIVGRADEVIITGGENVHPATVEAVLADTPGVTAVVAFGIADERWGQIVGAAIAGRIDEQAPARWSEALPAFARPREIAVVSSLPILPTGKLDRRAAAGLPRTAIRYR